MSEKTPVRINYDSNGNAIGFAELQADEFIGIDDGGTGATTASGARTALGLEIGSDIQGYDADLATLAGLSHTNGYFIVSNGTAWTATNDLPDGTTATTQSAGDNSTKVATTAYVDAQVATEDTLAEMNDVTLTNSQNGDFLRYNGSVWINDAVNLSTDTIGDYVESLVAGTGISVSVTSGEAQTPTVAVTMSSFDTDDLTEGSNNLYYTNARADARICLLYTSPSPRD